MFRNVKYVFLKDFDSLQTVRLDHSESIDMYIAEA